MSKSKALAYVPSKFEVQLTFNGVAQTSVWYTASSNPSNVRFAAQADATSLATGRYPWEMKVIGRYANGDTATQVYSGNAEIVNHNASNFGDNWTLRELDRLVPQSGVRPQVSFIRNLWRPAHNKVAITLLRDEPSRRSRPNVQKARHAER